MAIASSPSTNSRPSSVEKRSASRTGSSAPSTNREEPRRCWREFAIPDAKRIPASDAHEVDTPRGKDVEAHGDRTKRCIYLAVINGRAVKKTWADRPPCRCFSSARTSRGRRRLKYQSVQTVWCSRNIGPGWLRVRARQSDEFQVIRRQHHQVIDRTQCVIASVGQLKANGLEQACCRSISNRTLKTTWSKIGF